MSSYPLTPNTGEDERHQLLDDAYRSAFKDLNLPETSKNGILGLDTKTVERMVNSFSETIKVVIAGLEELQKIHPFIGVAVIAFKLVVTLDLTRRENNKKVIAIQLQMQDMMCILFQLRNMKDPDVEGPDGRKIEDRMQELMETIAKDVKECGSACDVYLKKGFLAKTLKSKIYEQRLAEFAERFVEHRNTLQLSITAHISLGVEAANEKLDKQDEQLRSIGEQLRELFRRLDTPRERDFLKFIDENGGARACIEEDVLLEKLLRKSGESSTSVSLGAGRHGDELPMVRRALLKELSEDLDDTLRRNMTLFEGKLDIQLSLITAIGTQIADQEHNIISAIRAGSYERISDPHLQELWKEMGWKGSVKARHFVLALRDHFADKFSLKARGIQSGPDDSSVDNDQWTLSYVNIAFLQPILEAIDDDGTGFINIKEVNTFCRSCPPNWTLLQWLAYWAAGWQLNITKYKNKIYSTIQKMIDLFKFVHDDNKQIVSDYLDNWVFCRLDLLLRSTKSISESVHVSPELADFSQNFASSEENLFETKLKSVLFEIDSPTTVVLVTGPGRIERYIYPLIHLILQRHVDIVKYACHHILYKDEFERATASLTSLFTALDDRTVDLEAIYKQMHLDVKSHFQNFAFGMFLASYGGLETLYRPSENELFSWLPDQESDYGEDDDDDEDAEGYPKIDHIPPDILKYGALDTFLINAPAIEKYILPDEEHGPLHGLWSGYCFVKDDVNELDGEGQETEGGLLTFCTSLETGSTFQGNGDHYLGIFQVEGSLSNNNNNPSVPAIEFAIRYGDGSTLRLEGFIDVDEQSITGKWYKETVEESDDEENEENDDDDEDEDDDDDSNEGVSGTFTFTRTPSDVARFKYTSREFKANRARSRWSFAIGAILHRVRREMGSWDFIKSRLAEGRNLLRLTVKSEMFTRAYATSKDLASDEWSCLDKLREQMDPADSRLYHAFAEYVLQRQPFHGNLACDGCEGDMVYDRYTCITCITEDLTRTIDLCSDCIDKTVAYDIFSHNISHTLLRSEYILIDARCAWLIPEAQKMSRHIKASFRDQKPSRKKPLCACCEKVISLPCWVCVECSPDIYICQDCHLERRPILSNGRNPDHHPLDAFMRIYDSAEVEKRDDNQLNRLERRLETVETMVEKKFITLDDRLSVLESLLKQLVGSKESSGGGPNPSQEETALTIKQQADKGILDGHQSRQVASRSLDAKRSNDQGESNRRTSQRQTSYEARDVIQKAENISNKLKDAWKIGGRNMFSRKAKRSDDAGNYEEKKEEEGEEEEEEENEEGEENEEKGSNSDDDGSRDGLEENSEEDSY